MTQPRVIYWFRQDLRLSDNPALSEALKQGNVLAIYILDDSAGKYKMGAASRSWLHNSLVELNKSLGYKLALYRGDPLTILAQLCEQYQITQVFWNRCYEGWRITRDMLIKEHLLERGIAVKSSNGSLLWEPWVVKKNDGTPYKVFTPFYRKGCLSAPPPRQPLPAPEPANFCLPSQSSLNIEQLELLPKLGWDKKFQQHWSFGEVAAQECLINFIEHGIHHYKEGRNYPSKPLVSRLSPYLHFGEISPNQAWYALRTFGNDENVDHFCSELAWREFSYSQLYYHPDLAEKNLQAKFDNFPWQADLAQLTAWQRGMTGIPLVDAGMRELWATGYMHNRVRMVVGSFLVKNLLIDWRHGERWFWDCLVDADLANNSASWQWIAGCGADAAPYFRIFNPATQGEKFDPAGEYIRHYLPELSNLPPRYLFSPWEAPESILAAAGVVLGVNYPQPIVELAFSRQQALQAFKSLRSE